MDDYTPTPRCANPACRQPFLPSQPSHTYCSARCREATKKRRQRFRLRRGKDAGELIVPPGTTVTSDDGGEPAHWSDIEAGRVDPDLAGHTDDDGGQDEQDARAHAMIEADAARRIPRRPWTALKMAYSRNPGIELADITEERAELHQAQQSAVKARLRAAPGQVEDRFNEHTRDAVATGASTSRRLNKAKATADPRPVAQRQSFSFEAEQATWDAYRGGRARGQQSRHIDYAWNMDDGFRF